MNSKQEMWQARTDRDGFGPGGDLPDHTRASQRPPHDDGVDYTAAEIERGYKLIETERIPVFDPYLDSGTEPVGNPLTYGGFLGRPRGWQR